jgi:DNA-binding response OmpR family regulator
LAQERLPDLVLLDRHLPDMLGDDILAQLKASADTAGIPVVLLSGDNETTLINHVEGHGANDFLTKPFDAQHFLAVIDRWSG